jgi:hypothetical protein
MDDSLAEYEYLWDGSEPGWTIQQRDESRARVSVVFETDSPSVNELKKLRQVFPGYSDIPLSELKASLQGRNDHEIGDFESSEVHEMASNCDKAGLVLRIDAYQHRTYLPVNEITSIALIIEDDDLAKAVAEHAIERGLPVRHSPT